MLSFPTLSATHFAEIAVASSVNSAIHRRAAFLAAIICPFWLIVYLR